MILPNTLTASPLARPRWHGKLNEAHIGRREFARLPQAPGIAGHGLAKEGPDRGKLEDTCRQKL